MTAISTVAIIGFGEVGQILAEEVCKVLPISIRVYDPKLFDSRTRCAQAALRLKVVRCRNAAEAARNADLVISAVTAQQTIPAARLVVLGLGTGVWFMDLNSASPGSKRDAAKIIADAGGRYIEVAVMSPIEPQRLSSPMLLGGPHAQAFEPYAVGLGFVGAAYYSEVPGKAAATKLCRSVMVKGLEALISESLLSARYYGVEDTVLESLNNLFPHPDWPSYAHYLISRTLEHGTRRAEEMSEAAKTVNEAGITPWMSEATARRQAWASQYSYALLETDLNAMIDVIRDRFDWKDA